MLNVFTHETGLLNHSLSSLTIRSLDHSSGMISFRHILLKKFCNSSLVIVPSAISISGMIWSFNY
ncbi:hypothetical protein BpHYR1_040785 [Brachionus plicatilis]|uniref:Uncharacterized protein n=1 Tax=Brachionus plicatilis TaxID=10195 RepID=A0A3M7Q1A3_BRAPC|nr:hypothetical protein BpHYR1_040785 [Brachionus plicatilis]